MTTYVVTVAPVEDALVPLFDGFVDADDVPSCLRAAAKYAELNEPVAHDEQAKPLTGPIPAVGGKHSR